MPSCGFLLFEWKIASTRFTLLASRPDLRVDKPNHRLAFDVHSDDGMNKETRRSAVASRTEAPPLVASAAEINLGRVLHRQHSPADTLPRRPSRCCFDDRFYRDVGRGQKAVRRYLASARLANLTQHQRSQCSDTLDQPIRTLGYANVSKGHRQVSRRMCAKTLNLICFPNGISFLHSVALQGGRIGVGVTQCSCE
jgi:hypothetical protein